MKHSAKHQSWFNRTSCIIMLKKKYRPATT